MTDTLVHSATAPADAGARPTRRKNAEHGFVAPPALIEALQDVLVDLLELQLQAKQAHWNLVGKGFRSVHLALDEVVDASRTFSDEVAERMRALHATPDGRSDTVAATTTLPVFPAGEVEASETIDLIVQRLEAAVATMRRVHDVVDEADPTSADLLHVQIQSLEQSAWMFSSENRG